MWRALTRWIFTLSSTFMRARVSGTGLSRSARALKEIQEVGNFLGGPSSNVDLEIAKLQGQNSYNLALLNMEARRMRARKRSLFPHVNHEQARREVENIRRTAQIHGCE